MMQYFRVATSNIKKELKRNVSAQKVILGLKIVMPTVIAP
jgi:hypothetical protein